MSRLRAAYVEGTHCWPREANKGASKERFQRLDNTNLSLMIVFLINIKGSCSGYGTQVGRNHKQLMLSNLFNTSDDSRRPCDASMLYATCARVRVRGWQQMTLHPWYSIVVQRYTYLTRMGISRDCSWRFMTNCQDRYDGVIKPSLSLLAFTLTTLWYLP